MDTYKGEGKITISRWSNTIEGEKQIHIVIEDGVSGVRILEFAMSLEDFAKALTGQGYVPGDLDLYRENVQYAGMKRIHKQVVVKTTRTQRNAYFTLKRDDDRSELLASILKPYEKDGWTGQGSYLFNHHYAVGSMMIAYQVPFTKFVTPEEAEAYNKPKEAV